MRRLLLLTLLLTMIFGCGTVKNSLENEVKKKEVRSEAERGEEERSIEAVVIYDLDIDFSKESIRALEIYNDEVIGIGSSKGFSILNFKSINEVVHVGSTVEDKNDKGEVIKTYAFRSVAFNEDSFFVQSIESPASLYKCNLDLDCKLVYEERHEKAFYDSVEFWNDKEGIAMGDPTEDCLSIIVTRDEGETWNKLPCSTLPKVAEGEAAFAASDTNIAIVGEQAWIISGGVKSRVFHTSDKGKTWEVVETPLVQGTGSQGGYSIDFFDAQNGFIIGGDYTKAEDDIANKAITNDGGKTWQLIADGQEPDYRSCVQYIPNGKGNELVAVGFRGISYSNDFGKTWKKLSEESFFTIRFLDASTAYAAGKGRVSKLIFK
ncbi:MAG: oxidoreductase [Flavobacteriaceae bacterium]|nr:oxidoreductase [Flavobacteriaceae bacterium]